MSARIPDTMLLSDLLKATGYDCPSELQGLTFAEVTVTTAVPNKLYAYGTAEGVVFLKAIPTADAADAAEVAVYVPSATGLTAGTGSYTKETDTVTVSTDSYARYADGDFQI